MGTPEGARRARAARSQQVVEASLAADDCRPLIAGIDTLNLSTRAELSPSLVTELRELRECAVAVVKARKKGSETAALPRWRSTGTKVDFEVQPHGTKKGLCLLTSEQLVLIVNPDGPRNFPRAYVEVKSPLLWAGWKNAGDMAEQLLRETVITEAQLDTQVSRIDLACDFMGWQPTPDLLDDVVGRVVRRDLNFEWGEHERGEKKKAEGRLAPFARTHGQGRRFTGFTFGGGDLLARLYDKTVEIRRSGKKWFEPKWQAAGWKNVEDSGHVWRLEFQVRREPLRQARVSSADATSGLKGWAETAEHGLDPLWEYLTRTWLSYRLPRTATERVRIHPRWQRLADTTFVSRSDAELCRHYEAQQLERCTGATAGYLLRELSLFWKHRGVLPREERFESDAAEVVRFATEHYEKRHEKTLFEAAREKWTARRKWEAAFGRFEAA